MNFDKKHIVIAVDGHSSCGKSTMAKEIAKTLNIIYIDSGAMYRAVTLHAMNTLNIQGNDSEISDIINTLNDIEVSFTRENGKLITLLNGNNVEDRIRQMDVSEKVSFVSAIPEVREKLVDLQRRMSESTSIIMDGRDIGTVVFPKADVKLFVTANAETRAKRRFLELEAKGENPDYQAVLNNVVSRDKLDSSRKTSPLKQADDAVLVDNSEMSKEQQLNYALNIIKEKL